MTCSETHRLANILISINEQCYVEYLEFMYQRMNLLSISNPTKERQVMAEEAENTYLAELARLKFGHATDNEEALLMQMAINKLLK